MTIISLYVSFCLLFSLYWTLISNSFCVLFCLHSSFRDRISYWHKLWNISTVMQTLYSGCGNLSQESHIDIILLLSGCYNFRLLKLHEQKFCFDRVADHMSEAYIFEQTSIYFYPPSIYCQKL